MFALIRHFVLKHLLFYMANDYGTINLNELLKYKDDDIDIYEINLWYLFIRK